MTKKKALGEAQENLNKANERLKAFEGIDPEKVRELLAEKSKAEAEQLEAKGQWDKLKAQMVEAHTSEVNTLKGANSDLEAKLKAANGQIAELTVGQKFSNSTFISEKTLLTPSKARKIYGEHFDIQEDGSVVAFDKPRGDAKRVPLVDSVGDNLGFDAAIKKLVEADPDRDHILKSDVKPGSNSRTEKGKSSQKQEGDESAVGKNRIAGNISHLIKKS
ncbi:MAG: hypothetical protein E2592_06050 [Methylobacillus sp.]|nr:hypothetical protein [Methylobacillus sp.]